MTEREKLAGRVAELEDQVRGIAVHFRDRARHSERMLGLIHERLEALEDKVRRFADAYESRVQLFEKGLGLLDHRLTQAEDDD
jgi:hypothetical protein